MTSAPCAADLPPRIPFVEFIQVWNDLMRLEVPEVHRRMAAWLEAGRLDSQARLLLLAFRGAGKSTIVGLYCAWLLATDPSLRILVLAADLALARKMVRNVKRIVERHPLTAHLRPKDIDQWGAEQFTVMRDVEFRDPSMLARGITGNFTGTRADIVICDDVEVPRTSETADKRERLREKLLEIDFVLVPGGQQLYIGTPHSARSLYRAEADKADDADRPFLYGFERLEIPLLDARGVSAWPERFTPAAIDTLRAKAGPFKFASQAQLECVDLTEARLDPSKLRVYDDELVTREANGLFTLTLGGRRLVSASCWWDPSLGRPDRGDASVVAVVFASEDGFYWLHDIAYLTVDDDTEDGHATVMCRRVAAFARRNFVPTVTVETNGVGAHLPGLLRVALRRAGVRAAVDGQPTRTPKHLRILGALEAHLSNRDLHVHRRVLATPLTDEMGDWRPGRHVQRDDGLDALAGCLLTTAAPLPRVRMPAAKPDWRPGGGGYQAVTSFEA